MSMSPALQPLHIFRKDARHLWPETLVSIALLVAFAWAEVQTWQPVDGFNPATLAVGFIKFLLPVAWLVLTSRLVHDEELVGDRQFWITRPYTWYSLLGAKVLYLIVFIGIPFFAMQAWLLHHAGLYPTQVVPALLRNLLQIACLFLLPLLALAAVTATFVRYISSVLVGLIYFFIVVAIAAYYWPESFGAPAMDWVFSLTLLALVLAALLLEYWRRKTLIARLLLAAAPLVLLLLAALTPINLLVEHHYPAGSAGTLALDPNPMRQQPAGRLFNFHHEVVLEIPLQAQLSGLDDRSVVEAQRMRVVIDGPGGYHYSSDWTTDQAEFAPGMSASAVNLRLPEKVFNRIHNDSVALHVQLGTQIFHAGTEYNVTATETAFPAPGHAACTVAADTGKLECRYPFANPVFTQVAATVHNGNCLAPGPLSATAHGAIPPTPIAFGISPVEITHTDLRLRETVIPLCPGTVTTFTPTVAGAFGRMTLDIPSITLDPYARRIPVAPAAQGPTLQH